MDGFAPRFYLFSHARFAANLLTYFIRIKNGISRIIYGNKQK